MQAYDPEKAARIWDRVRQSPAAGLDVQKLPALINEERTDAALYLMLSKQFQGKQNLILRQMAEQEQTHAACLKGIYTLVSGKRAAEYTPQPENAPLETILRHCYGREMRSLAAYEARSSDPEYGQVFSRLAAQEREHCRRILELLGSMAPRRYP